jgi:hypothetical protein
MKPNVKVPPVVKKLWKMWTIFCGVAVLLVILNYLNEWMNPPVHAQLPGIECLDNGGTWNAEEQICTHAS